MILTYQRSGGFTGMQIGVTIDTDTLPVDERAALVGLVEAAEFFELPPSFPAANAADGFVHVLTVDSAGRHHTVEVSGLEIPPPLSELLTSLSNNARRARRSTGASED